MVFVPLVHSTEEGYKVFSATHVPHPEKPEHKAFPASLSLRAGGILNQETPSQVATTRTRERGLPRSSTGLPLGSGETRGHWDMLEVHVGLVQRWWGEALHSNAKNTMCSRPLEGWSGTNPSQKMETNRCERLNSDRHSSVLAP